MQAPYEPFRRAAQETLKEEYGHVGLGMDAVKELLLTAEGREQVEAALKKWVPIGLQSFGGDKSKKNDQYRRWGIKQDTNENMRLAYYEQIRGFIEHDWGIKMPADYRDIWSPSAADASGEQERVY